MLGHYYHVWADGDWQQALTEHFDALTKSGLTEHLEFVRIGLVGSAENCEAVKTALPFGDVVIEADMGWEQVTLTCLRDWVQDHPEGWGILYAHTKGAWNNKKLRHGWRRTMTHDTVTGWRNCVKHLDEVDAVGPFWMARFRRHQENRGLFFGGNFWWARSEYLVRLPELELDTRFRAEDWIGLKNPDVVSLRDGEPGANNFLKP